MKVDPGKTTKKRSAALKGRIKYTVTTTGESTLNGFFGDKTPGPITDTPSLIAALVECSDTFLSGNEDATVEDVIDSFGLYDGDITLDVVYVK